MKISELIIELQRREAEGYGDKPVYVEDSQELFHIDSVQKNTSPSVEPEYLFLMPGGKVSVIE